MIQTWTIHKTDDLNWIVKHNGNSVGKTFYTPADAMRSARRRAIGATRGNNAVVTEIDDGFKVESPGPMSNRQKLAKRWAALDRIAQNAGWDNWSHFGTAVKSGDIAIPSKKP